MQQQQSESITSSSLRRKELKKEGWQFLLNEPKVLQYMDDGNGNPVKLDTPKVQTKEEIGKFYQNHGCNEVLMLDEAYDDEGALLSDYFAVYVR